MATDGRFATSTDPRDLTSDALTYAQSLRRTGGCWGQRHARSAAVAEAGRAYARQNGLVACGFYNHFLRHYARGHIVRIATIASAGTLYSRVYAPAGLVAAARDDGRSLAERRTAVLTWASSHTVAA